MRTRLAVMALIISLTTMCSICGATTYIFDAPELLGDYGGNLTDLNQDGYINVGDLQLFIASHVSKKSETRTSYGCFQHALVRVDQVRLHLVGTAVDNSGGLAPYFSVDNGATLCPPLYGAFDQTTIIPGHSEALLRGDDTIKVSLTDDGQFWQDIDGHGGMAYALCTITAASVEIDGMGFWVDDPDGYVNVGNLQRLVVAWGSMLHDPAYNNGTSPNWDYQSDINRDGFVNVGDLQGLLYFWGR